MVGLTRTPKIRTYTDEVRGPLDGLKVIELAGIGPAPYACMLLADLGADVLRLERGDVDADHESTWEILNRSRPSVAVDLKNAAGRDLVLELCEQADVLIEGFRPGVTERLGLGPQDVAERNPRLVYGRMTGYGQEGPNAQRAGHDINYIAVSGALWPMGRKGEAPVPPLNLVGDFGGGSLFLAFGVVAAVLSARATGEGQVVDAAMVDGSASLMALTHSLMNAGFWHEERGIEPARHGRTLLRGLRDQGPTLRRGGRDRGQVLRRAAARSRLRRTPTCPHSSSATRGRRPRSDSPRGSARRRATSGRRSFEDVDACVTPVLTPREAAAHPYNTARGVFSLDGDVQPQPAPRFSKTPGAIGRSPGKAGSGTREGLLSLGH